MLRPHTSRSSLQPQRTALLVSFPSCTPCGVWPSARDGHLHGKNLAPPPPHFSSMHCPCAPLRTLEKRNHLLELAQVPGAVRGRNTDVAFKTSCKSFSHLAACGVLSAAPSGSGDHRNGISILLLLFSLVPKHRLHTVPLPVIIQQDVSKV